MTDRASDTQTPPRSRRDFIKASTAAVVGGSVAGSLSVARSAHAAGSDVLRLGLVGCGGRGTGAANQSLLADPQTKLVAMADAFADRLQKGLSNLKRTEAADRVQVDADHQFVGFDAYQQLINSDVDVVLLATPPHFRPQHLRACIDAGKHVFAEKPVAVDAPGVRHVLETCQEAKRKNLAVVSGLCWRYETGMQQTIEQIHAGAIGDPLVLQSLRYAGGVGKLARRQADWSDMQYHMRNWYYFTWLSGDFIVEQFVHELDKMAWVMHDETPSSCICVGGRQTRTAPEYGHIFDHFSAVFEYSGGQKLYAATRHQPGCSNVQTDEVIGTRGHANLMKYTITGSQPWHLRERRTVMHQLEQDAMYAALRRGEIINNGRYMAHSTMMAVMARMSAYTGKHTTWEQAMNSQEDLSPPRYTWDVPLGDPPVAMPGITPFV